MSLRRPFGLVLVLLALGAASCGGGDRPTQVAAGGDPQATTTAPDTVTSTSTTTATTATTPTAAAASTTTVPVVGATGTDPSPVAGLDADDLKAAVDAPLRTTVRRAGGPTVDQVVLADGTRVWRVRIPGSFPARGARVAISVGDRVVGQGVLAPTMDALTAVTADGSGLTAGQPVRYQWEGSEPVAVGTLEVAR